MKIGTGYLGAAAAVAIALAATPALAQPGGDQQPPSGGVTGPATPQPGQGPTLTVDSSGQTQTPTQAQGPDSAPAGAEQLKLPGKGGNKPVIWHDTSFIFQQAVSSETIGIGKDYQSRNPDYELWFSFRPRVYLYEDDVQKVNVNFRADLYKELTNGDDTTQYRQDVFGDIWMNLAYSRTLVKKNGWSTGVSVGPRFLFPTSIASRAAGVITTAGGGFGVNQGIPLNKSGDWLKSARVVFSAYYTHPFTKATTAESDTLDRPRTDINGVTGQNNQLSGGLLTEHQVLSVFDTGIQITPKLGLTADMIYIQQWRYTPSIDKFSTPQCPDTIPVVVQNGTACTQAGVANTDPQRYRVSAYFLASVDYQLTDELNVEVGYYNFANSLGPDGQRRNPFWAPETSRFYLSATLGLDALYERFRGDQDVQGGSHRSGNQVSKTKAPNPLLGQF